MVDPKSDERRTPLFMAAENGAFDAVTLLMDRGADVTIRDTELRSVLHVAVGHPRVIENLLQVRNYKNSVLSQVCLVLHESSKLTKKASSTQAMYSGFMNEQLLCIPHQYCFSRALIG